MKIFKINGEYLIKEDSVRAIGNNVQPIETNVQLTYDQIKYWNGWNESTRTPILDTARQLLDAKTDKFAELRKIHDDLEVSDVSYLNTTFPVNELLVIKILSIISSGTFGIPAWLDSNGAAKITDLPGLVGLRDAIQARATNNFTNLKTKLAAVEAAFAANDLAAIKAVVW